MTDPAPTAAREDIDELALLIGELQGEGGLDRDQIIRAFHFVHHALEKLATATELRAPK